MIKRHNYISFYFFKFSKYFQLLLVQRRQILGQHYYGITKLYVFEKYCKYHLSLKTILSVQIALLSLNTYYYEQ